MVLYGIIKLPKENTRKVQKMSKIIKTKDRIRAEEAVEKMSYSERAVIYAVIRKSYVKEDVYGCLDGRDLDESLSEEEYEELADTVAERYVFEGEYDCNQSYWSNLDHLIDEEVVKRYCKEIY